MMQAGICRSVSHLHCQLHCWTSPLSRVSRLKLKGCPPGRVDCLLQWWGEMWANVVDQKTCRIWDKWVYWEGTYSPGDSTPWRGLVSDSAYTVLVCLTGNSSIIDAFASLSPKFHTKKRVSGSPYWLSLSETLMCTPSSADYHGSRAAGGRERGNCDGEIMPRAT